MLKETLQRSSESFGSNYYLKENLIYQARNHWLLTTLIVILFADKILTQWFPLYFLCFVFATYGYIFFYSSGLPRKFPGPSNQWLYVVCLCHCCVSRLLSCSSVLAMAIALGAKKVMHIASIAIQANAHNISMSFTWHWKHASGKSCLIKMIIFHTVFNSFNSLSRNNICFPFMHCFSTLSLSLSLETSNGIWLEEYRRDERATQYNNNLNIR